MIYLIHGTDTDKTRAKMRSLVDSLIAKKPDATHEKITDESFDSPKLDELISSFGLFSSRAIVEMGHVFRNKIAKEEVIDRLKAVAASENIFIFLEDSLTKKELTAFEKHAEKIQNYDVREVAKERPAGLFPLADALGRRDKKGAWVLYTKAKRLDIADEEIHGMLFWQIKSLILAESASSATEAGLNPFVYQKSARYAKNFEAGELKKISGRLIDIYHQARRGMMPLDLALEKFILEL